MTDERRIPVIRKASEARKLGLSTDFNEMVREKNLIVMKPISNFLTKTLKTFVKDVNQRVDCYAC